VNNLSALTAGKHFISFHALEKGTKIRAIRFFDTSNNRPIFFKTKIGVVCVEYLDWPGFGLQKVPHTGTVTDIVQPNKITIFKDDPVLRTFTFAAATTYDTTNCALN
jgi:hypothetical protein